MISVNTVIRRTPSLCGIIAIAFLALPVSSQAIQINDYAGLCKIGVDTVNYPLNGDYELTANIDASSSKTANGGAGFAPIGSSDKPFSGKFDGKGHKISGLYINRPSGRNVGLFGYVDSATISRVVVAVDTVSGISAVGALVGRAQNSVLDSCISSGTVRAASSFAGGLAGSAYGYCVITRSAFSGTVTGTERMGGLTGYFVNGQVTGCNTSGDVSGTTNVGGLIGTAAGGQIEDSNSSSAVEGTVKAGQIGGLIGYNEKAAVTGCMSTGSVKSQTYQITQLGGLIGYNSGTVTGCGSTASVEGGYSRIGGLIGENADTGTVTNCYYEKSRGSLKGDGYEIGGLIGVNRGGVVTGSRAKISVFGDSVVGGLIGANYSGTVSASFYQSDTTYDYYQDIRSFIDTIYGTGNKIGGLIGLNQGTVTKSYSISNVRGKSYVGGLIGWNADSSVTRCYSKGSVIGTENETGGLIGRVVAGVNDSIMQCYSTSSVKGSNYVGGLVGNVVSTNNSRRIIECYSVGFVIGTTTDAPNRVGGLVGNVYAQNNVARSYWAADASGQTQSVAGIASDTLTMRVGETYEDWDFNNVWKIDFGKSYPYFIYETAVSVFRDRPAVPGGSGASVPRITIRGRTLNISASANSAYQIRLFDLRGKVVARFTANGGGSFPLGMISAGRYLVETRMNGKVINVSSHKI